MPRRLARTEFSLKFLLRLTILKIRVKFSNKEINQLGIRSIINGIFNILRKSTN